MPIETKHVKKTAPRALLASSLAALALLVWPAAARGQCLVNFEMVSNRPIRVDSNHVMTSGETWATDDTYGYWTPYEEAWQEFMPQGAGSGGPITGGSVSDANPGDVAESTWTSVINDFGPGTYWDYSAHWGWRTRPLVRVGTPIPGIRMARA